MKQRVTELMRRFVSGQDRSRALVNEIEGILIEDPDEEELFEALSYLLSLYRPGAPAPYVGEDELAAAFSEVLAPGEPS